MRKHYHSQQKITAARRSEQPDNIGGTGQNVQKQSGAIMKMARDKGLALRHDCGLSTLGVVFCQESWKEAGEPCQLEAKTTEQLQCSQFANSFRISISSTITAITPRTGTETSKNQTLTYSWATRSRKKTGTSLKEWK